jgi:hypothetical protein
MKAFFLILGIVAWTYGFSGQAQSGDIFAARHAVATAGQRTKIAFIPFVYPNCGSYGDVKFGVYGKPQHGDLFLAEDEEVLSTNQADLRPRCDGKPIRGLKVEYLPQSGYIGDDKTLYYIENQSGDTWNYYQTIEVKD